MPTEFLTSRIYKTWFVICIAATVTKLIYTAVKPYITEILLLFDKLSDVKGQIIWHNSFKHIMA